MKNIKCFILVASLTVSAAELPVDAIVVSSTTKTVVETVSKEWRTIQFNADVVSGDISVTAVYETVVRVDGVPKFRSIIRESVISWTNAVRIAPALIQVREQLNAAMPTILTNTP